MLYFGFKGIIEIYSKLNKEQNNGWIKIKSTWFFFPETPYVHIVCLKSKGHKGHILAKNRSMVSIFFHKLTKHMPEQRFYKIMAL